MKILIKLKKFISIVTASCLMLSFVIGPTAANAMTNEEATSKYKQIFKDFMLPYNYGQITSAHYAGTDRVIINIQDLHCHPKVQKNISNIIEIFDSSFGVKKVYLEGAYGQVDTSWISKKVQEYSMPDLLDKMLDTGRLTGAEYYSVISGKNKIINGLEEKGPYLDNLKRFGDIVENQGKINLILNAIDESLAQLKQQYYSKRQYKLEELSKNYREGTITPQKYYALLSKHTDKLEVDLSKYENTFTYMMLLDMQKKLDYSKITNDLQNLVLLLNENLPYNAYQMLVDNTDNFSKIDKLYGYIIKISRQLGLDLTTNFPDLDNYFGYIEFSQKINPLDLIDEEEQLVMEINTMFSETKAQREVVFLTNFERYIKDYVSSKITSKDYEYYKENIEKFRELWNEYVDNRVLSLLDDYLAEADTFYKINTDRNIYFTRNMFHEGEVLNKIETEVENKDDVNKIIDNMKGVKEVDVVITGGFHSQTVTEILKDHGVSYIVITPNVTDGVKLAEDTYYEIAKEQSKISFQALANLILSLLPSSKRQELFDFILTGNKQATEDLSTLSEEEAREKIQIAAAKLLESDDSGEVLQKIIDELNKYSKEPVTEEFLRSIDTEKFKDTFESALEGDISELQRLIDVLQQPVLQQSISALQDTIRTYMSYVGKAVLPSAEQQVRSSSKEVSKNTRIIQLLPEVQRRYSKYLFTEYELKGAILAVLNADASNINLSDAEILKQIDKKIKEIMKDVDDGELDFKDIDNLQITNGWVRAYYAYIQGIVNEKLLGAGTNKDKIATILEEFGGYENLDSMQATILFYLYRDNGLFEKMIDLYEKTGDSAKEFKNSIEIRELYFVAFNKTNNFEKTIDALSKLEQENLDEMNGELYGALGKAYYERYKQAREKGGMFGALGQAYHKQYEEAIKSGRLEEAKVALRASYEAYNKGFEIDHYYYPGINAVYRLRELAELTTDETERAQMLEDAKNLAALVYYSTEKAGGVRSGDYWTLVTMVEAMTINGMHSTKTGFSSVNKILDKACEFAHHPWEINSTLSNLENLLSQKLFDKEGEKSNKDIENLMKIITKLYLKKLELIVAEYKSAVKSEDKEKAAQDIMSALSKAIAYSNKSKAVFASVMSSILELGEEDSRAIIARINSDSGLINLIETEIKFKEELSLENIESFIDRYLVKQKVTDATLSQQAEQARKERFTRELLSFCYRIPINSLHDSVTKHISGNYRFGGGLQEMMLGREDMNIAIQIIKYFNLDQVESLDEFMKKIDIILRTQYRNDELGMEDLKSDGHSEFDNKMAALKALTASGTDTDSRTNIILDFLLGIGDCRQHGEMKQVFFDVWKEMRLQQYYKDARANPVTSRVVYRKIRKLQNMQLLTMEALVVGKVAMNDMYSFVTDVDGKLIRTDKDNDIEEHVLNILVEFDDDGNIIPSSVQFADSFYQHEYKWGWKQQILDESKFEIKLDPRRGENGEEVLYIEAGTNEQGLPVYLTKPRAAYSGFESRVEKGGVHSEGYHRDTYGTLFRGIPSVQTILQRVFNITDINPLDLLRTEESTETRSIMDDFLDLILKYYRDATKNVESETIDEIMKPLLELASLKDDMSQTIDESTLKKHALHGTQAFQDFTEALTADIDQTLASAETFHTSYYEDIRDNQINSSESPVIDTRLFDEKINPNAEALLDCLTPDAREKITGRHFRSPTEKIKLTIFDIQGDKLELFYGLINAFYKTKKIAITKNGTEIIEARKYIEQNAQDWLEKGYLSASGIEKVKSGKYDLTRKDFTDNGLKQVDSGKIKFAETVIANTLQVPWEYLINDIGKYGAVKDASGKQDWSNWRAIQAERKQFLIGLQTDGIAVTIATLKYLRDHNITDAHLALKLIHAGWSVNNTWEGLSAAHYDELSFEEKKKDYIYLREIAKYLRMTDDPIISGILQDLEEEYEQSSPADAKQVTEQARKVSQADIADRVKQSKPRRNGFAKEPIFGYRLSDDLFVYDDEGNLVEIRLPKVIKDVLGQVDSKKYSDKELEARYKGSIISLQTKKDGTFDFYPVGEYQEKYEEMSTAEARKKNSALYDRLQGIEDILTGDSHVVGAAKKGVTKMIRMSDLGYPIDEAISIEDPWGTTQTKPAGRDAYLVLNEENLYYMVNIDERTGLPISYVPAIGSQMDIADRVAQANPDSHGFTKEPIFGYRLSDDLFVYDEQGNLVEVKLPKVIKDVLGRVDSKKYSDKELEARYKGSIISLQTKKDGTLDFYPVGGYQENYEEMSVAEAREKNAALYDRLQEIEDILAGDSHVVGAAKKGVTRMIKMSDLGYPIDEEISIEDPWGETQTKPAGRDAYLVLNEKNMYYMVNIDEKTGLPISYLPAEEEKGTTESVQESSVSDYIDLVRSIITSLGFEFDPETGDVVYSGYKGEKYTEGGYPRPQALPIDKIMELVNKRNTEVRHSLFKMFRKGEHGETIIDYYEIPEEFSGISGEEILEKIGKGEIKSFLTLTDENLLTPSLNKKEILREQLKQQGVSNVDEVIDQLYNPKHGVYVCQQLSTTDGTDEYVISSVDSEVDSGVWGTMIDTVLAADVIQGIDGKFKNVIEFGTGAGHLAATMSQLDGVENIYVTDISPFALVASLSNILKTLESGDAESAERAKKDLIKLIPVLGPGIQGLDFLESNMDMIVVNPPYIDEPENLRGENDLTAYGGTKFLREILENLTNLLNSKNPDAQAILSVSSTTRMALERYLADLGYDYIFEPIGTPQRAPLKVPYVTEDANWIQWLLDEGMAYFNSDYKEKGLEPYSHDLVTYRVRLINSQNAKDERAVALARFNQLNPTSDPTTARAFNKALNVAFHGDGKAIKKFLKDFSFGSEIKYQIWHSYLSDIGYSVITLTIEEQIKLIAAVIRIVESSKYQNKAISIDFRGIKDMYYLKSILKGSVPEITENLDTKIDNGTIRVYLGSEAAEVAKKAEMESISSTLDGIKDTVLDLRKESEQSEFVLKYKVPVFAKNNRIQALVPDFSNEQQLIEYGFEKRADGKWYSKNESYPDALSEDSIILRYSSFCSRETFFEQYVKTSDYNAGKYIPVDKASLVPGAVIDATKMATANVVMVPEGTMLATPEGNVRVKSGEVVMYVESGFEGKKDISVYAMPIADTTRKDGTPKKGFLSLYLPDPYSPTSAEFFLKLKSYASSGNTQSYRSFVNGFYTDLNRDHDEYYYDFKGKTLKEKFEEADGILRDLYERYLSRIDVSDFDEAFKTASDIIDEVQNDPSIPEREKMLVTVAAMTILMPKTNPHQHFKTAVSEDFIMDLLDKKLKAGLITQDIADKAEKSLAQIKEGFATLDAFNHAYRDIGELIRTREDYEAVIKFIIEDAVKKGQSIVEIRTACDSMVKDLRVPRKNWEYYSAEEGMTIVLDAINKTCEELRAKGMRVPDVSCVVLASRSIWKDGTNDLDNGNIERQVDTLLKFASRKDLREKYKDIGLGFDIAGSEDVGLPPRAFIKIYRKIARHNAKSNVTKVGTTIHSSETPVYDRAIYNERTKKYRGGKAGFNAAREAVENLLGLERVGHGLQVVLRPDNVEFLKAHKVTVEICPTCNIVSIPVNFQTVADSGNAQLAKEHPVETLLKSGVRCVVATDNALLCTTDINMEYIKLIMTGHDTMMNWNMMKEIARNGILTSFISEEAKARRLRELDQRTRQIETLMTKKDAYGVHSDTKQETSVAQTQAIQEEKREELISALETELDTTTYNRYSRRMESKRGHFRYEIKNNKLIIYPLPGARLIELDEINKTVTDVTGVRPDEIWDMDEDGRDYFNRVEFDLSEYLGTGKSSSESVASPSKQTTQTEEEQQQQTQTAMAAATEGVKNSVNPSMPSVQQAAIRLITSSKEAESLIEQGFKLEENLVLVGEQQEQQAKVLRGQGMNVLSVATSHERGGVNIGTDRNGNIVRVKVKDGKLIFCVKKSATIDVNDEIINMLITKLESGKKIKGLKNIRSISYTGETGNIDTIIDVMKIAHTYSVINPIGMKYMYGEGESFKSIADKTGIVTFILTKTQAEDHRADIERLKDTYKFVIMETDVNELIGTMENAEVNGDEYILDLSGRKNMTLAEAEGILKQIHTARLSLKKGLDITVSVKFSEETLKALSDSLKDSSIYEKYGVIPIVSGNNALSVRGKKEVDEIGEMKATDIEALKGQEIVGVVVDKKSMENLNNGLLDNIRTVMETISSISGMSPERKYKKGQNAAMSTKFDYGVSNIQALIDSGVLSVKLSEAASKAEDIRTLVAGNVFSKDAANYITYLLDKGYNEEVLGFIRGSIMNSLVSDISKILTIDEEKFQRDIKTNEVQAVLIMTIKAMMQGKTIQELYTTIEGSDELTAKEYLNSIRAKLNENLDDILRESEYSISVPAKGELVDFRGIPELLMDDFKKAMNVNQDIKISAIAVRSILAAA